jgi:predicted GNAT superfamily acetyltransferase
VLPEYRDRGIGRKLKMAQREEALARGIKRMEWTFDPLVIKNAYLNIVRLGVVVHSYSPNFYGVFSSRLQGGLPTDRLHAEWWMDSPRVQAALRGEPVILPEIQETIVVPGEIRKWKESGTDFAKAEAAQAEIRARFQDAFARRLSVVGFSKKASRELAGAEWNKSEDSDDDGIYQLADWREA